MRALLLVAVAGCSAASSDVGLDLLLQLKGGGQVRPGPFPVDAGGPRALDVRASDTTVQIGAFTDRLHGLFEAGTRTAFVGIGLDPDGCSPTSSAEDNTWIVPAGPPDVASTGPVQPTLSTLFAFEMTTPLGPAQFLLAGADDTGAIGARACFDITTVLPGAFADRDPEMEITLSWPGAADLDLHVIDPLGNEAWSEIPNTWRPTPGVLPGFNDYLQGGILDRDGNASCGRDVFPHEDLVWRKTHLPLAGTYVVRVDARSMCGDGSAAWHVLAYQRDRLLGEARGIAVGDNVTYAQHGYGAGTTAFTFTLP